MENKVKEKKTKAAKIAKKEQVDIVDKARGQKKLEVVNQVIIKKTLKYKYPKGLLEPQARKSYRQRARNLLERAELRVIRAKGSEEKTLAKENLAKLKEKYLSE